MVLILFPQANAIYLLACWKKLELCYMLLCMCLSSVLAEALFKEAILEADLVDYIDVESASIGPLCGNKLDSRVIEVCFGTRIEGQNNLPSALNKLLSFQRINAFCVCGVLLWPHFYFQLFHTVMCSQFSTDFVCFMNRLRKKWV